MACVKTDLKFSLKCCGRKTCVTKQKMDIKHHVCIAIWLLNILINTMKLAVGFTNIKYKHNWSNSLESHTHMQNIYG